MARFTEEQVAQARAADLESFLRQRGDTLKRSGREWRWVYRDGAGAHDSVTVRGSRWFDHKRQIGGDSIGFLQEFMGLEFRAAVAELIGADVQRLPPQATVHSAPQPERAPFALPPRSQNMRRLYAYLCRTRGLPHEVVSHFVHAGTLYEDADHHNAVFVATDEKNKPQGGMKKSTHSGSNFRQTLSGSDTRYAFHHRGRSGQVYVFEGAVDMLSFIALYPENWPEHSYLTLDGVSSKPLLQFLRTHEDIRTVCLCLDNDSAGQQAAARVVAELQKQGCAGVSTLFPCHKDWNDDLRVQHQTQCQSVPQLELFRWG